MKKIYTLLLGGLILLMASCSQVEIYNDYIDLSISSYSFDGSGKDSIIVKVDSKEAWEATVADDWVNMRIDGDQIILKADKNTEKGTRSTLLTVKSSVDEKNVDLDQLPNVFDHFYMAQYGWGAISRNGRYFAYINVIGKTQEGKVYDFEEGTSKSIEVPMASDVFPYTEIQAISNDGRTMIYYNQKMSKSVVYRDGKPVKMEAPAGGYYNLKFTCMSADGNTIIGYASKPKPHDAFEFAAIKWINGKPEVMEIAKTDTTIRGYEINSVIPRGCSSDGNIVYIQIRADNTLAYFKGKEFVNISALTGEVIRKEGRDRTWINALSLTAIFNSMSPNGKYIASNFYNTDTHEVYAALINTEDNTVKIWKDNPSAVGLCVTDSGLMFGGTPAMGIAEGLVWEPGSETGTPISDWTAANLGVTLENDKMVECVSEDLSSFIGMQLVFTPRATYHKFILKL